MILAAEGERGEPPDESTERRRALRAPAVVTLQLLLVVGASLVGVALRRGVPLVPDNSVYDGLLFARLARNLTAGEWLGEFNQLTLAKNPGYPIFLSVVQRTGIELQVAEHVVHLAAAGAVALAVLVVTRRRWPAVAGFVILALDPAAFGETSSNVMRENLYASLGVLVLVLGFLTALGIVRRTRVVWVALGAAATGAVVSAYWLTREEGITILPPLAVTVSGVIVTAVVRSRRGRRPGESRRPVRVRAVLLRGGVAAALVLITALLPLSVVRHTNEARYGVALLNDQTEGAFLRAYADWTRVEAGSRRQWVPITEDQRLAVYAASPAAHLLRKELEDPLNIWRTFGCTAPEGEICDYGGGWMLWAIRDAAASVGRFDTAREGQEYFTQLSEEITAACDSGRLDCAPRLPPSLQGLQRAPLGLLAENVVVMLRDTLRAERLYEPTRVRVGDVPRAIREQYAPVVAELPVSDADRAAELAEFEDRRAFHDALAGGYRVLIPVLVIAALAGLVSTAVRAARGRRHHGMLAVLGIGLLAGVLVRAFLLAVIETADFDVVPRYLLPGYALLSAFGVVGAACLVRARPPAQLTPAPQSGRAAAPPPDRGSPAPPPPD